MKNLSTEPCEACRANAPRVSDEDLALLLKQIPDWQPIVRNRVLQLQRIFAFQNFNRAMAFSNQIAELADAAGHHPAILTEWGKVTVTWWTHKINGLHRNDFILAARTDELLATEE